MTPEEGYQEAERRIEVARQEEATELDLSNLALTDVSESIGQLTKLEKLDFGGYGDSRNQLTGLPNAIANLAQLQSFDLRDNQLAKLPVAFETLRQLRHLNIGGNNQLTEFPLVLRGLTNLRELFVWNTGLFSIPIWIGELRLLTQLSSYAKLITKSCLNPRNISST